MYLRSSNSLHSILATVLCKKNEATWTQIPCFGVVLDSSGTTWYSSANHTQPGPLETRWQQPYHVVYKGHFRWTTSYGSTNHSCNGVHQCIQLNTVLLFVCKLLKEYEIITLILNRKSCRLYLLSF